MRVSWFLLPERGVCAMKTGAMVALVLLTCAAGVRAGAAELPKNPETLTTAEAVKAYLAVLLDDEQTNIRRNYAGSRIVALGKPALPLLVERYKKAANEERGYLSSLLGVMEKDSASEAVLLDDLKTKGLGVHPNVIRALGQMKSSEARPLLTDLLKRTPKDLRLTVIQALASVADENTADVLKENLDDDDRLVRSSCANGLVQLLLSQKKALLAPVSPEDSKTSATRRGEAGKAYEKVRGLVLKYCQEGRNEDARLILIGGLGPLNDPKAVPPLLDVLERGSTPRRASAADALGLLKADAAVDALTSALEEESPVLSRAAIRALVMINDDRCVPKLIDHLEYGPVDQRKDVVKGLQTLTHQNFGETPDAWRKWWISRSH